MSSKDRLSTRDSMFFTTLSFFSWVTGIVCRLYLDISRPSIFYVEELCATSFAYNEHGSLLMNGVIYRELINTIEGLRRNTLILLYVPWMVDKQEIQLGNKEIPVLVCAGRRTMKKRQPFRLLADKCSRRLLNAAEIQREYQSNSV